MGKRIFVFFYIKKQHLPSCGFFCSSGPFSETKKRKDRQILVTCERTKKVLRVTAIWSVLGARGTISKNLEKELQETGSIDTILSTSLLKSTRILRRVQETRRDLLSLRLLWKTICERWCEKIGIIIIMIIITNYYWCEKLLSNNIKKWNPCSCTHWSINKIF